MVSTFSSGSSMQWNPSYNQIQMNGQFTFIDFLPECRDPGGIFTSPTFGTFRTLVDRANDWLRANPSWKVVTCESVEFKRSGRAHLQTEKMVFFESGEMSTSYIRALRLWIENSRPGEERVQQIGYINIVPQVQKQGGIFSFPSYENLNDTISRFNTMTQTHPIPGRIITVESQEMKSSNSGNIDPDKSSWTEIGDRMKHFVFIIRVFYEISEGITEQLGVANFMPAVVSHGGVFSLPQYEPFGNVVRLASNWIAQQTGIRVCNAQSIEVKVKRGTDVDGQRMSYTEHGSVSTYYVRILRVAFTIQSYSGVSNIQEFTCKTFIPVQLTSGICDQKYESLMETKHRVSEWIKATGVQVLSAETSALRLFTGGEARHGPEASFTYNRSERGEYWISVIRIYINGSYQEPPQEMLPPVPELEQSCCTIL